MSPAVAAFERRKTIVVDEDDGLVGAEAGPTDEASLSAFENRTAYARNPLFWRAKP